MGKKIRSTTSTSGINDVTGAKLDEIVGRLDDHDRDLRQRNVEVIEDGLELGHDKIKDEPADDLHDQHEHQDVSQPRRDARPDRKLARSRVGGDAERLGELPGRPAPPRPGASRRGSRASARLRARPEASRPSSSGRPGASLAGAAVPRYWSANAATAGASGIPRSAAIARICKSASCFVVDPHARITPWSHRGDEQQEQQTCADEQHGQNRAGDDDPQPEQDGHDGDRIHEVARAATDCAPRQALEVCRVEFQLEVGPCLARRGARTTSPAELFSLPAGSIDPLSHGSSPQEVELTPKAC